ncbi:MAG: GerMN domain-containing protein [Lachnospiraceae bacterium]|uniref:GerMN domain-containing protein n=1 Tax=Hominifimenecus microfluidus TaxID=2885348 RepID=A0AAE3EA63_9FIRM|nr:GerMN domain-containing protein [Hominifimenecus microfluidus]MCC2230715.1 GerMN domain-containing protein [Hominifimenecus microfluidus]
MKRVSFDCRGKRFISACLLLVLATAVFLAGCHKDKATVTPGEGEIVIYYSNASCSRLISKIYTPQHEQTVELARELYAKMQEGGYEDTIPAVAADITISDISLSGNTMSIALQGPWDTMRAPNRMLFLAAVTRTLTQLKDVDGILFTMNGEALTDESGNMMGVLRSASFVDNAVDNPEDYREAVIALYFANEAMDGLVKVERTVVYRSSSSMERIVVEQLLRGPEDSGAKASLPNTASLLSINVRDGVCYVNFDSKFITEVLGSYDYVPVYSVVNSLTELPNVDKVQISINGSSETGFQRDILSFAIPFTRNMKYVEESQ